MPPEDAHANMSFGDHLEELRTRLIVALLGLLPILIVCLVFGRELLDVIIAPAQASLRASGLPAALQATSPVETFGAYLRVGLIATVLVGSPWLLWQIWRFVAPGLYARERRFVHLLVPLSTLLTIAGTLFLYYVLLPVMLLFFIGFGSTIGRAEPRVAEPPPGIVFPALPVLEADPPAPEIGAEWVNLALMQRRVCVGYEGASPVIVGSELTRGAGVQQQYRVSEYVGMVMTLALAFALAFQTPVVVLLLGWAGLIERHTVGKYRRHIALGCAVLGALLTPADPVSMALLAGPLYLLFELGMVLLGLLPAERVARGFGDDAPDMSDAPEGPDAGPGA